MDARFPRTKLVHRIQAIAARADQITLRNWDAEMFISEHLPKLPNRTLVYLDPPYYEKSSNLYLDSYSHEDHGRLAALVQNSLKLPWIVSYDSHPHILELYDGHSAFEYSLQYNARRVYKGREVFVFGPGVCVPATSRLPFINEAQWVTRVEGQNLTSFNHQ